MATRSVSKAQALKQFEDNLVEQKVKDAEVILKRYNFSKAEVDKSVLSALEKGFHLTVHRYSYKSPRPRKVIDTYKPKQEAIDRILANLAYGPDVIILKDAGEDTEKVGNHKWAYAELVAEYGSDRLVARATMSMLGQNADRLEKIENSVNRFLRR